MILFIIPAVALALGFLGARASTRSYIAIATVALLVCYIAYTR